MLGGYKEVCIIGIVRYYFTINIQKDLDIFLF